MTSAMKKLLRRMPTDVRQAYLIEWERQREIDSKQMADADMRYTQGLFNAICVVLHREYGFSEKRCMRVIEGAYNLLEEVAIEKKGWDKLEEMSLAEAKMYTSLADVGGGAAKQGATKIRFNRRGKQK